MENTDRKEKVLKILSEKLQDQKYRHSSFSNGETILQKEQELPMMGWNSWNAFGSENTEELTKEIADAILRLELDQKGYRYVVLDDGCYQDSRVNGKLTNNKEKFPSGFQALSWELHKRGLKFGMYNDIGTNLCAGAEVGTCGYEAEDARTYLDWDIDFIKVDNCYYLYDNATFSDPCNVRYVYAPRIRKLQIEGNGICKEYQAVGDGRLIGSGIIAKEDAVEGIGVCDGTGPEHTPTGEQSGELWFTVNVPENGEYQATVEYASGNEPGIGGWLQLATEKGKNETIFYDDFLQTTENADSFHKSQKIPVYLQKGENLLRLMNHRRQENTLVSYALLAENFQKMAPEKKVIFSVCEWGKTCPQNWGYKIGHSWRILNDICFQVGSPTKKGTCAWSSDYTNSITSQYNKAVIMDEYAGLSKGWNDPDMMVIGLDGLSMTMYRTHLVMWCMLNAPLMLGLDLRKVEKGDEIWQIIAKEELIALNQDALGIQAKRVFSTLAAERPDQEYIRDNERLDILAKPLVDGLAISFLNLSEKHESVAQTITFQTIAGFLANKWQQKTEFLEAESYQVEDLWTGETWIIREQQISCKPLMPCDHFTIKVTVRKEK